MPRWPSRTLRERLEEKILRIRYPNGAINYDPCHLWEGARSQSGRRQVKYPILSFPGGRRAPLRVNRLVLILEYGPVDVPLESGESFDSWFARALKYYASLNLEASHTCDNSACVNFTHLEWQGHTENLAAQVARRREATDRARYSPPAESSPASSPAPLPAP